ncbi:hypothetical protein [Agromyces sp. Leaf222]|uniref:hypothetical protein n=1 Tax=Agromyces sp. Leaf222 TaxID=1735688 RepID=UPI0006F85EAC|nr:hypothetical protein [Agromyces sp. Leaf222]KQM81190.1 hypothetical protein ASE68_15390 [Agromyces sp. Leaf222]
MPHQYALHTDVEARCLCCESMQHFVFASPTDHVVCEHCRRHLGDEKAERRDREHVALWRGIVAARDVAAADAATTAETAAGEAARTIAGLTAERDQLRAGAIDATGETGAALRRDLEGELVRRAERATELTNRRLDRGMLALWRLQAYHHPDPRKPGACTCGKPLPTCPESRVLEGVRQEMRDWEARNLALLRDGKRHGLPPEHPEVAAAGGGSGGDDGRTGGAAGGAARGSAAPNRGSGPRRPGVGGR